LCGDLVKHSVDCHLYSFIAGQDLTGHEMIAYDEMIATNVVISTITLKTITVLLLLAEFKILQRKK
jgi:hypothetical protein